MNYLINPDISEEIDGRETDLMSYLRLYGTCTRGLLD